MNLFNVGDYIRTREIVYDKHQRGLITYVDYHALLVKVRWDNPLPGLNKELIRIEHLERVEPLRALAEIDES